jgi:hypothetical protein
MRSGRGLVQVIAITEAANPAHGVQALLKGCEAAICPTERTIVIRAPRIVLCFSGFFNADDTEANSQREQQGSHGRLLVDPQPFTLFPAPPTTRRGGRYVSMASTVFDACKGLPETVQATGSNCKNRDCRRSRSGGILLSCGIGNPNIRPLPRYLSLRTMEHHQKLGRMKFPTTSPSQGQRH